MFGFLNLIKPAGMTSRDCVNRVLKRVRPVKVGHCGTLDPLATGVLVIGLGPATRLIRFVQDLPKHYVGTFQLGVESDSEDTESELRPVPGAKPIQADQLRAVLPEFVGRIQQLPPRFSALKVNGRRAYELARKGKQVELEPRPIEVHRLELVELDYPQLTLNIECGSGTYVRSLGRDIGRRLDSGAVMTDLQRTAVGPFRVQSGVTMEEAESRPIEELLLPAQSGLDSLPQIEIDQLACDGFQVGTPAPVDSAFCQRLGDNLGAALDPAGRLIAIVRRQGQTHISPKINFAGYWSQQ